MALFGKKKNEYNEASKNLNQQTLAVDKIIMEQLDDNDNKAASLVDSLKNGSPLVINFENLDPTAANKMLAFFAGACYALDGRSVKINEKTYLFARRVDFFDGSIQKFIDSVPKA